MKKSPQQRAKLRTCARCEWVYDGPGECPECGFASYGARWVYGAKCYKHKVTQAPWVKRKLDTYAMELHSHIYKANAEVSNAR